jgi:hypothetical protein
MPVVTIEIHSDAAGRPVGQLVSGSKPSTEVEFSGWLDLLHQLDQLLHEPDRAPAAGPSCG